MNRILTAARSFIDTRTSEFWYFWGTIAASFLTVKVPGFSETMNGMLATATPHISWEMLLEGWGVFYVLPRLTSKLVKAPPKPS